MKNVTSIISGLKFLLKNMAWVIVAMEIISFAIEKIEKTNNEQNGNSKDISSKTDK